MGYQQPMAVDPPLTCAPRVIGIFPIGRACCAWSGPCSRSRTTSGVGLGPAFSGVMRTLGSLAPGDMRGALFGSIYILIYVSMSVPTVLAGVAVAYFPLPKTTYVTALR
jgi:hypothetical protein